MKTKRTFWLRLIPPLILAIGIAACRQEEPAPAEMTVGPSSTQGPVEPAITPTIEASTPEKSEARVARYNLGETTIVQEHFPEDSPFRNMPVRLDGVIGVPESDAQHPVVIIMHGSHASCPGENEWPCSGEEEQKNFEGFEYLVEALAEAGYIALSINVNAEHTFGFGEAPPTIRTKQLIDLHLSELAAANEGASNGFGLDLTGRIDPTRMTWLGHSRGGEFANRILREQDGPFGGSFEEVQGLIQVAPSLVFADSLPATEQAMAIILPACDQDVVALDGQNYFESARSDPGQEALVTSVYLEGANHNNFNAALEPEASSLPENRPDCTDNTMLTAGEQQSFLADYTIDLLRSLYGEPEVAQEAERRLGFLISEPIPESISDFDAVINFLSGVDQRLTLIQPQGEEELSQNQLGGEVRMQNLESTFCPAGYYVPDNAPGKEACRRVNFNQPGFPQQLVIDWDSSGAEYRTSLPAANADLTTYSAFQFRTALDPLSDLNSQGEPQSFTIELVDNSGQRGQLVVPEINFPEGVRQPNEFFEGGFFTGHVHMQTVRIPLDEFGEIDFTNITEIALLFDQTFSGAIFMADLGLIKAGPIID